MCRLTRFSSSPCLWLSNPPVCLCPVRVCSFTHVCSLLLWQFQFLLGVFQALRKFVQFILGLLHLLLDIDQLLFQLWQERQLTFFTRSCFMSLFSHFTYKLLYLLSSACLILFFSFFLYYLEYSVLFIKNINKTKHHCLFDSSIY